MHFGKSFDQILSSLPEDYQAQSINYKKLKKLIRAVVIELEAEGLSPELLQELLKDQSTTPKGKERAIDERPTESPYLKAFYQLSKDGSAVVPHLKIWTTRPSSTGFIEEISETSTSAGTSSHSDDSASLRFSRSDSPLHSPRSGTQLWNQVRQRQRLGSIIWALRSSQSTPESRAADTWGTVSDESSGPALVSLLVPLPDSPGSEGAPNIDNSAVQAIDVALPADATFFAILSETLAQIARLQKEIADGFMTDVRDLARAISLVARPVSERGQSDLYAWRGIFSLWVESQVFESTNERTRGERGLAEAEDRLGKFAREVTKRGLGDARTLKRSESQASVDKFLQLNLELLNLKKFEQANSEAVRKILKKHAKRTSLPTPNLIPGDAAATALVLPRSDPASSLAHTLLLLLTETLLPVLPSVEDYTCLICTSIAFKPIRLDCSHLFCVRCLVKMQRARKENCPLCRAPSLVRADKHNLDTALVNLMEDWFPKEVSEKVRQNEQEIANEELRATGITSRGSPCQIQ
ncbi:SPX domain-containing protein [Auriculariales sp. MPI-PUGE-AT-0066]|nr:SPX domain-containing protein [Auriculariales sp. MPI-PUGE-AT-0066]